jgi:predicted phosphoadenosine phosphosulfate sulfurtransferase
VTESKRPLGIDVLEAARQRIAWTFDNFDNIYVAYSGGKDSTVMLYLTEMEARLRERTFSVLVVDLEGNYQLTLQHMQQQLGRLAGIAHIYWVCLPLVLRNAMSVFEPRWLCWDPAARDAWIQQPPDWLDRGPITDPEYFSFFRVGMEFEEFVAEFGEWIANGAVAHLDSSWQCFNPQRTACLVGIRTDESLNRFRTIQSKTKETYQKQPWTTRISNNTYNIYPIYDWRTEDIWTYHARQPKHTYNHLYDVMFQAGMSIHQARICQPYGDDQRRGLWLFQLIEPETWARVVARVAGANMGRLYINETGNVTGYRRVSKPNHLNWQQFAESLIRSMPPAMGEHYQNKILLFQRWWVDRGYPDGIPDEMPYKQEADRSAPSWRRVVKTLLRNDYWCKGLGFSQTKSDAYSEYQKLMSKRRQSWGVTDQSLAATRQTFS